MWLSVCSLFQPKKKYMWLVGLVWITLYIVHDEYPSNSVLIVNPFDGTWTLVLEAYHALSSNNLENGYPAIRLLIVSPKIIAASTLQQRLLSFLSAKWQLQNVEASFSIYSFLFPCIDQEKLENVAEFLPRISLHTQGKS